LKHGEVRNRRMVCHSRPREISVWFAKNCESTNDVQPAWSGFLEQTYAEIYCAFCDEWIKCRGVGGTLKWVAVHSDGGCRKNKEHNTTLEIK